MSDIRCRHCQEPWDAYGVHHHEDMTEEEAHLFLAGKGCPSCHYKAEKPAIGPLALALQARADERFLDDLAWGLDDPEEIMLDFLLARILEEEVA